MFLKILFLIVSIFVASVSFGQKNKRSKVAPPGTVQTNDTFFVDKTEIANVHWREYLHYLEKFDSLSFEFALPDTTVWGETVFMYDSVNNLEIETYSADPLTNYYFRHPGFNDYPAVGISYEQAVAFCQWRTFAANFQRYIEKNDIKNWQEHIKDSFPINFYYRLPSEKEWEMIAAGKLPVEKYPYGYDSSYIKWKKRYIKAFNCKFPSNTQMIAPNDRAFYTVPSRSFFPNSSKAYCMIGNVAEMVSEKGIAKGGSFIHNLEECKIDNNQYYTKPERWLGFRCVAVVVR